MENHFEELNLRPQASINDVKTSYRRLAKRLHPDTAPSGGDAIRFAKVHQAYKALMNEFATANGNRPVRNRMSSKTEPAPVKIEKPEWRFESVSRKGANTIYAIRVNREAAGSGLNATMPWKAEGACPRCLGVGHTFSAAFGGPHMLRMTCPKCRGAGTVTHESTVRVNLTPEMIGEGKIEMKGLGRYQPKYAARGNLIIEIHTDSSLTGGNLYAS